MEDHAAVAVTPNNSIFTAAVGRSIYDCDDGQCTVKAD